MNTRIRLLYFCQRGAFAGYWRSVPYSYRHNLRLHAALIARGHIIISIPAL